MKAATLCEVAFALLVGALAWMRAMQPVPVVAARADETVRIGTVVVGREAPPVGGSGTLSIEPVVMELDEREGGSSRKLWVPTGVHHEGKANVWVHVPARFDREKRDLRLAVIFRGHKNCIDSYVSATGLPCVPGREARTGYGVAAQVEKSGTTSIVILPELAFDTDSSDPGRLAVGGFDGFVADVLRALAPAIGERTLLDVRGVTLISSSGGFEAAIPILQRTRLPVDDLVLFDSLYNDNATFRRFVVGHEEAFRPGARAPRRLTVLYCKAQRAESEAFGRGVELALLPPRAPKDRALVRFEPWPSVPELDDLRAPVSIFHVAMEHDQVVARYLWQVLRASEDARTAHRGEAD